MLLRGGELGGLPTILRPSGFPRFPETTLERPVVRLCQCYRGTETAPRLPGLNRVFRGARVYVRSCRAPKRGAKSCADWTI
jgi:hypothetical protein